MNKKNSPTKGQFLEISDPDNGCDFYKLRSKCIPQLEWDPKKSERNLKDRKMGFERAYDLLNCSNSVQMISPGKWETINEDDFESKGIEKNEGNLDPIRGMIIGELEGKLWVMVYTFRGELGDMKYRVISLRRADKKEIEYHNSVQNLSK